MSQLSDYVDINGEQIKMGSIIIYGVYGDTSSLSMAVVTGFRPKSKRILIEYENLWTINKNIEHSYISYDKSRIVINHNCTNQVLCDLSSRYINESPKIYGV